ncbi:hypothetical protein ACE1AT_21910 [Pelatocladus sp. BLCC-F211]|uniref:hypothetical protein n=1 Tax=Pelatocladus sp. BLCC-F211 TaxID=3342752 RepID=UPI0035B74A5E
MLFQLHNSTRNKKKVWLINLFANALILFGLVSCQTTSPTQTSDITTDQINSKSNKDQSSYPPASVIVLQVCGVSGTESGEKCINVKRNLWEPIGEAKLVKAGFFDSLKLIASSAGCVPPYKKPISVQFYDMDAIFRPKTGIKPTASIVSKTKMTDAQINNEIRFGEASLTSRCEAFEETNQKN